MDYWPWWVSGLALSGVMVFHWFSLHRMMAVSGRLTALIDRFRHGRTGPLNPLSPEEMLAAIQAATLDEFGTDSPGSGPPTSAHSESNAAHSESNAAPPTETAQMPQAPRTTTEHFLFLGGLALGGALASSLGSGFSPTLSLGGSGFVELTGGDALTSSALLALGGVLVGFGTRMSGGCTSGHGLCGTSRLQPGSLVATLSFFGIGIVVSFLLGAAL